ncbi:MAG: TenA family transcriptional regulator [Nitrososphaeraceae archaeon]
MSTQNIIVNKINNKINEMSLLKHPFYVMWTEGKLTIDHLQGYSKEYFQLVKSVPNFVDNIYANSLLESRTNDNMVQYIKSIKTSRDEESEHVKPWIDFSLGLGLKEDEILNYFGDSKVIDAVNKLKELSSDSLIHGISMMYAFEKQLPEISTTKMEGLNKFYGIKDENVINYFRIHEKVDIKHAKLWEDIILNNSESYYDKMYEASIRSLKAQNQILDAVYDKYILLN